MRKLKFLFIIILFIFINVRTTSAAVSDWDRGVSMRSTGTESLSSQNTREALQRLKETGSTFVSFVINYYQTNISSTDIYRGWDTPTDESLINAINYAHSIGLDVSLKMHLETSHGDWRANISPNDRDTWYTNYGNILNHYATLGEENDVEEIIIGTELIKMASHEINPDNTVRWKTMINSVRSIYDGNLTYSANWGESGWVEEASKIEFWGELDYIGISAYYPLRTTSSVNDLKAAWTNWDNNRIKPLNTKWNKPVRFTEIGYRSTNAAHTRPWDYWTNDPYSGETQANAYEALFSYWNDVSYFDGVNFWEWEGFTGSGGEGNTNYTPQNKPAELVMKQWYGGLGVGGEIKFSVTGENKEGQVNTEMTAEITVQNEGVEVEDRNIDIEIYKDGGGRIHQDIITFQDFLPDESRELTTAFTPTSEGTYTVKVGIFDKSWGTLDLWEDNAAKITIGSTPPPPPDEEDPPPPDEEDPPGDEEPPPPPEELPIGDVDVWWPSNGSTVSGVQPFKAMLQNRDISEYDMFWQVDGDRHNEMFDDNTDWPHKEVQVDLTGWNWKGTGPYILNFIAKDKAGAELKSKTVEINIVQ